jgi:hypothetical protein
VYVVPRKVLKDRFEEQPEEDELAAAAPGDSVDDDDEFEGYDTDEFFRESAAFSPSPNLDGNPHEKNLTKDFTQRTTPRPPPHAKAKGGGAGNSVLVACLDVRCCVTFIIAVKSQFTLSRRYNYTPFTIPVEWT